MWHNSDQARPGEGPGWLLPSSQLFPLPYTLRKEKLSLTLHAHTVLQQSLPHTLQKSEAKTSQHTASVFHCSKANTSSNPNQCGGSQSRPGIPGSGTAGREACLCHHVLGIARQAELLLSLLHCPHPVRPCAPGTLRTTGQTMGVPASCQFSFFPCG